MAIHRTRTGIVLQATKGKDRFVLIFPDGPAGRVAAKQAVRSWLLNCELDFDRDDAEQFWRAIDARRLSETFGIRAQGSGQ